MRGKCEKFNIGIYSNNDKVGNVVFLEDIEEIKKFLKMML